MRCYFYSLTLLVRASFSFKDIPGEKSRQLSIQMWFFSGEANSAYTKLCLQWGALGWQLLRVVYGARSLSVCQWCFCITKTCAAEFWQSACSSCSCSNFDPAISFDLRQSGQNVCRRDAAGPALWAVFLSQCPQWKCLQTPLTLHCGCFRAFLSCSLARCFFHIHSILLFCSQLAYLLQFEATFFNFPGYNLKTRPWELDAAVPAQQLLGRTSGKAFAYFCLTPKHKIP